VTTRRQFLKILSAAPAIYFADRALGHAPDVLLASERGYWVEICDPMGRALGRKPGELFLGPKASWDQTIVPCVRVVFGPTEAIGHWRGRRLYKDGHLILAAVEDFGTKCGVFQTWDFTWALDIAGIQNGPTRYGRRVVGADDTALLALAHEAWA